MKAKIFSRRVWQSVGVAARGCGKMYFFLRETYVFHMCCFGGGVCLSAARQDGATEAFKQIDFLFLFLLVSAVSFRLRLRSVGGL